MIITTYKQCYQHEVSMCQHQTRVIFYIIRPIDDDLFVVGHITITENKMNINQNLYESDYQYLQPENCPGTEDDSIRVFGKNCIQETLF